MPEEERIQRELQQQIMGEEEGSRDHSEKRAYEDALEEVPIPPKRNRKEKKERVKLSFEATAQLEEWQRGSTASPDERSELLNSLALPASDLSLAATLDDDLKLALGSKSICRSATSISERELFGLHELITHAINQVAFARHLITDGGEDSLLRADDYLLLLGDVLAMGIKDVVGLRRQIALSALGLQPADMPSLKSLPLDGSARFDVKSENFLPNLFGSSLKEEVMSAESAVKKSIEKLKKDRQADRASSSRNVPRAAGRAPLVASAFNQRRANPRSALSSSLFPWKFAAGAFGNARNFWKSISSDPNILEAVSGYRLPFKFLPPVKLVEDAQRVPRNLASALVEFQRLGIIAPLGATPGFFSSMFGVPKKDGQVRPILNLKLLNRYLIIPHFKMESLKLARDLINAGDFLVKLDFTNAYFSVNIAPNDRRFLAINWEGTAFCFTCMPFGLATAPFIYTKLMTVLATKLREQGGRLIHYLDDWLLVASSVEETVEIRNQALSLFFNAGITVNLEKSILVPCQELEFLGVNLNSHDASWHVPLDKRIKIKEAATSLRSLSSCSARVLSRFLGQTNFVSIVEPFSKLYSRELQRCLKGSEDPGNFDRIISITEEAKLELSWWIDSILLFPGSALTPFSPTISIQTDASLLGWGAVSGLVKTGGRWTTAEKLEHINVLELRAIFFGLRSLGRLWEDKDILIECDNKSAIAYLQHFGGTTSRELLNLAREIWSWSRSRRLRLRIVHKPGKENIVADFESRNSLRECCEWSLHPDVVARIFCLFGRPELDLFATRLNAKCNNFYSFFPDPASLGTDAFSQNWSGTYVYAFPPFALLPRVLAKAKKEKTSLVLITPLWKSQVWFPLACQLAEFPPILLPTYANLLVGADGNPHPLLGQKSFRLVAWKISSSFGQGKDWKDPQRISCWPVGLPTLFVNMSQC